jgi:hypothetical protein
MKPLHRTLSLILIVTLTLSSLTLIMTHPTNAQVITKPSVPEFALKYVDYSYDIPAEYGIDQFTGQTIVTKSGQHFDNRTVEISIKNQPFNNFTDSSSGKAIDLFYNVRYKGTFTESWTEMYGGKGKMVMYDMNSQIAQNGYPNQTYGAQYTTVSFSLSNIPNNVQIEFQVQALEGYTDRIVQDARILFSIVDYEFTGQTSGYSNTQTITIGTVTNYTPNPTLVEQNPTATLNQPAQTNSTINSPDNSSLQSADDKQPLKIDSIPMNTFLSIVTGLIVVIAILSVAIVRMHRKQLTQQNKL